MIDNFIHIPKTGGTSVKSLLTKKKKKGFTLTHKPISGSTAEEDFFTVVRNPYDRAVSHFYFLLKTAERMARKDKRFRNPRIITAYREEGYGVNDFIKTIKPESLFYRPQLYFLQDELGEIDPRVKLILKTETLNEDFKTHFKMRLPRKNKSKGSARELNEESREIIRQIYAEDFVTFGYEE